MRIGIVAEGNTDFPVIEQIVHSLRDDAQCERISPPPLKGVGGWTSVRTWCRRNGKTLKTKLKLWRGVGIDLLIIQIDADVADTDELDIAEPCPPASDTTDKLRRLIIEDWLGVIVEPPYVVLCVPSLRIEAWIAGTFEPDFEDIECSEEVDGVLIKLGAIEEREVGRNKKSTYRYRKLAEQLARKFDDVCEICTEAARFREDMKNAFTNPLT